MLSLPKVSDPANLMFRQSLHQGGTPVQQRYLGCPAANLFNPVIPPAVGKVDNLMTMSRSEMADLISRQQGDAEKVIQNLRENQQEQLEAPASAMEEYYMAILKDVRMKEQAEIDNAYLTQQQKNDLQGEALARKAGIDGNIMRYADELAARDRRIAELTDRLAEQANEEESRMAVQPAPFDADEDDEMGRRTAASMASAAGTAAASRDAMPEITQEELARYEDAVSSRLTPMMGMNSRDRRQYVIDNGIKLIKEYNDLMRSLQAKGVYKRSRTTAMRKFADFVRSNDSQNIMNALRNIRTQLSKY